MNRFALCLALAAGVVALAQEKKEVRTFNIRLDGAGTAMAGPAGDAMFFSGGPGMQVERFGAQAVKGAPYAAEATTESVQVLQDGNRIVHKNSSKMYRDAEGRTRMENTFPGTAMWTPAGGEFSMTFINDPVAKVHYTLNNKEKTATKLVMPAGPGQVTNTVTHSPDGKTVNVERNVVIRGEGGAITQATAEAGGPAMMVFERHGGGPMAADSNVQKENLGQQTIEGVVCNGTRQTITIPAGKIGNEREIKTVIERWTSPDLGFDLLRKQTDPRSGETTYRVTGIVRADQPKSLFEVPADYKMEDVNVKHVMSNGMHTQEVVVKSGKE
ncbi:MAG: hypothetical protein HY821_04405 [Acidobacteria bacterium]|nr:hypothetical protein [Acidobacteriota bacterium]